VIDQFTILKGGALDADRAADKFRDSLHDLKKSVKENGAEIADHTRKGRDNKEAIRQSIEALNDKITADYKATAETKGLKKATKDAAKELRDGREDILDHAEAAGLNREKVADMID